MGATDPSAADAVAKGTAGAEDISSIQFQQFRYYCLAHISHAEDCFYQHQDRLLNDAAFDTFVGALKDWSYSSGMRAVLKRARNAYAGEFVEFNGRIGDALANSSGNSKTKAARGRNLSTSLRVG